MCLYNKPKRVEEEIIADLRRLTSNYELSKKIGVPMSSETVHKCILKILEKEPELR